MRNKRQIQVGPLTPCDGLQTPRTCDGSASMSNRESPLYLAVTKLCTQGRETIEDYTPGAGHDMYNTHTADPPLCPCAQLKQSRRQVADLLRGGKAENARIRVESVMREEQMLQAYEGTASPLPVCLL